MILRFLQEYSAFCFGKSKRISTEKSKTLGKMSDNKEYFQTKCRCITLYSYPRRKKLKNVEKQTYPLSYPQYPQWKNERKNWKKYVNIKHLFCVIFLNNSLPE